MELYQKKRYLPNQGNKGMNPIYDKRSNELNKEENIYLNKMLEQNKLSNENITNIRTNMKNILSDENNFKRAMKYVAKYNRNNPNERYNNRNLEKSASPLGRRSRYKDYPQNTSPLRKVLNITREPLYRYENIEI